MAEEAAGVVVWVTRGDVLSLAFATDVAVTAVMAGDRVQIALFDAGAAGWCHAWDATEPAAIEDEARSDGLRRARLDAGWSLAAAVADCRALGGERFSVVACSGALDRMGADPDALVERGVCDDVLGLPTLWRHARGCALVTV